MKKFIWKSTLNIASLIGLGVVGLWYVQTRWLLENRPKFPDVDAGFTHRIVEHGSSIFVSEFESLFHIWAFPFGFALVATGILGGLFLHSKGRGIPWGSGE